MLLIILSWVYIVFTTINLGFGVDKLFKLQNKDFVVTSVLGLFATTILASFWAIFGRINIEFHYLLLTLNLLIFLKFKDDIFSIYTTFINELKTLSKNLKYYLAIITFCIIAQCSSIPYVIDNESYYIQTIKWLNEYGFVKGLVNLHFFLGQVSGWHITQSALNFSFLYKNFNDLSGFCLLLGNIFAIQKLNTFFENNDTKYLIVGLFPLFNLFLFQFISAPSPDIPVYVFTFVILFYYIEKHNKISPEIFNLLVILILFTFYIKNTTVTFFLIPLLVLILNYKILSKKLLKPTLITIVVTGLFVAKNMIICGSMVFPSKLFNSLNMDYSIPDTIEQFYYDQLKYYGYFIDLNQYNSMSVQDLFLRWLTLPKMNGLFNKISILLVLIVPILLYKFQNKKEYWSLYFLMLIQLILLFATSPQYRFFMNFIFFFSLFCLTLFIKRKKPIYFLLQLSLFASLIVVFLPVNLNRFSNYKFMMEISNFSSTNIIFPHKNTKFDTPFETIKKGNLIYNSPIKNDFFWSSGDGNLPSVNKEQIEYFEKYFHIIPQLRTKNIKDGFYAKEIIPNE
ncbi:MAG: hypothetical protein IPO23_08525 [Flavobacterium sp.]|nr:hypothetical protein [Flavobacterium sp.]